MSKHLNATIYAVLGAWLVSEEPCKIDEWEWFNVDYDCVDRMLIDAETIGGG